MPTCRLAIRGDQIDTEYGAGRFILFADGRWVGYLNWLLLDTGPKDEIFIADVLIEAEADRRKGYARALVQHFEEIARRQGFTTVRLAMVDPSSLGFWKRLGYSGRYGSGFSKSLRSPM